jgi:hypothetical protein
MSKHLSVGPVTNAWEERISGSRCLLTLAGTGHGRDLCMCLRQLGYGVIDHVRVWRKENGKRVITVEPYNCDGTELMEFLAYLKDLGLDVWVTGVGQHNCTTFMIVIKAKQEDDR